MGPIVILILVGLILLLVETLLIPGFAVTGILGILEPITSLVCSILLLGEPLTPRTLAGGLLVLVSAFLITLGDHKKSAKES